MTRSTPSRLLTLWLAVLVLASACGSDSAPPDEAATGELAFGLQRCDPDAAWLAADPSFYRDEPIYVGNEQPLEEVRAWFQSRSGYEDIWIDRERNGWISVGFSKDAAERQAEVEARFPDAGVVVVAVDATQTELRALRSDVEDALSGLSSWGLGHSVPRGMVEVSVPVLDDETLARLAPLAGPMLCVEGLDPADAVADGPQPTEGDGWRLLGTDRTGAAYRTGVATTPEQYRDLWNQAGLRGDLPAVDFETEIAIWFGAVYGSSCPIRMDGVVFDLARRLVYGEFVMPGNPTACTDDANAEAYVVAVPRTRLPEAPFAIQLDADDPPAGVPEERTTVEADLRANNATVTSDDLSVDTLGDQPPQLDLFWPDYVIEPGFPSTLLLDLDCSVDVIGPLNATMWLATDADLINGPPPEWEVDANDRRAIAEFLLTTDPASLTITVNGLTVFYEPVPAGEEADMSCS